MKRLRSNAVPALPEWWPAALLATLAVAGWTGLWKPPAVVLVATSALAAVALLINTREALWWRRNTAYKAAAARLEPMIRAVPIGVHVHVGDTCLQHAILRIGLMGRRMDVLRLVRGEYNTVEVPAGEPFMVTPVDVYSVVHGRGRVCHQVVHHKTWQDGSVERVNGRRPGMWASRSGVFDMSVQEMAELADLIGVALREGTWIP